MQTLCDIAINNPPKTWERLFKDALPELTAIDDKLKNQTFIPTLEDVFKPFYMTPLHEVKVVIFADQPYSTYITDLNGINKPRSTGLAYSVEPYDQISPALETIYLELYKSLPSGYDIPDHGDLREWADQGVLLLNLACTLQTKYESNHGIWMGFIYRVLNILAQEVPKCIFLLWGNRVKTVSRWIGEKSIIFEAVDPASYYREQFLGCNHFIKVNQELMKQGKDAIVWKLKPKSEILAKGFQPRVRKTTVDDDNDNDIKPLIKLKLPRPAIITKNTRLARVKTLLSPDQLSGKIL